MRVVRILNREIVQVELPLDTAQQIFVRLVEAQPHEPVALPQQGVDRIERHLGPDAAGIRRAVDDPGRLSERLQVCGAHRACRLWLGLLLVAPGSA